MKTLVKIILFIALVVAGIEFTTKGESGAFGGFLVKAGIVKNKNAPTLKQRVESNLDKARSNEAKRYGDVEKAARGGD